MENMKKEQSNESELNEMVKSIAEHLVRENGIVKNVKSCYEDFTEKCINEVDEEENETDNKKADSVADILSEMFGIKFKYGGTMKDEIKNNDKNEDVKIEKSESPNITNTKDFIEQVKQNNNKIYGGVDSNESLLGKYTTDEKINNGKKNKDIQQETLADKIEKEKNHIGGKCKVIKHQFIKEGTELIIKDVLPTTAQVMCCTNVGDILYLNVEDIEIIEDKKEEEWKDIYYKWEFPKYNTVTIKQNYIYYYGYHTSFIELKLDFSKENIKSIVKLYYQDIEKFKDLILKQVECQLKDKEYNKLDEEIDEKMDKLEKMGCQCDTMQEEIKNILNIIE